jgi:hypothetical protein
LNPEDLQKEEIYKFHSKKFIQNTFESWAKFRFKKNCPIYTVMFNFIN